MGRTIVQGGQIVDSQSVYTGDIVIEDERITSVSLHTDIREEDQIIDASGLLVLPGIVDAHTHIQLDTGVFQTADNWLIGTQAAAAGGVTTVVDFATQFPGQSFDEAIDNRLKEAENAVIDYAFHCMITDLEVGTESAISTLIERGLPSLKIYTTYKPNYFMDDATMLRLFYEAADLGGLVIVHAENDDIVQEATQHLVEQGLTSWRYHALGRPAIAEQEAINRVLFLANEAEAPVYVVHCSTARSVELVKSARDRGQAAWCETCPQYLLLDDRVYEEDSPEHYILQPPLRSPQNPKKLWQLIQQRAVSVISTDSCDYTLNQKQEFKEFTKTPGGLPGVETLLSLMYTYGVKENRISFSDLVKLLCENPAKMFGIAPKKGYLRPGSDADIVLYNPDGESHITQSDLHYLAEYSPYQNMRIQGRVAATISRGQIIYQNETLSAENGRGQFVPGQPFSAESF